MARNTNGSNSADFSSFAKASSRYVWPWSSLTCFPSKSKKSSLRMVKVHREGGVGYIAGQKDGVMRFKLDRLGKVLDTGGDVILPSEFPEGEKGLALPNNKTPNWTGLTLSNDGRYLIVAGLYVVCILDVTTPMGKAPARIVHYINLSDLCQPIGIKFRNALLVGNENNILYVDGHYGQGMKGGTSISMHRLVLNNTQQWGQCQMVMGNMSNHVGWVDKCGNAAVFTRPHDMVLLPGRGKGNEVIVMTDIDNRAIRTVEINLNTDSDSKLLPDDRCVKTVSYDEGLLLKMDNNIPQGQKQQYLSIPSSPREPHISHLSQYSSLTFENVRSHCKGMDLLKNSDMCTLREIRQSIFMSNDDSIWNIHDSLPPFWTSELCQGCWVRHPTVCREKDPSWGSDYWMMATVNGVRSIDDLRPQYGDNRGIQTECIHESETPGNNENRIVICCGEKISENQSIFVTEILTPQAESIVVTNDKGFSIIKMLVPFVSLLLLYVFRKSNAKSSFNYKRLCQ